MGRGASGRVVVEIDPETKELLYQALARDHKTLKQWFLECANSYLYEGSQLALALEPSPEARRVG